MSTLLYRIAVVIGLILCICAAQIQAQQTTDAKFGSIPDSLFQMQPPAENPDAPYMITNKEMDVSFRETGKSIVAILKHHVRLKVFDESAREASLIAIPYYFDNDMEQISSIEAYTYLPDGKRIPLSKNDIRTINLNSRYNVKEFTMPSVENGAILEYSYVIERRYIEELPDFFLSDEVPTATAKLTITYPKYLRYKAFTENYNGTLHHDFVYTDTSSVPKIFTIPQPKPVVTERWVAYDIPRVEKEAFLSSLNDYRGKLKFLMSEFGIPRQHLENNWEVVVARIREKTNPWLLIEHNQLAKSKGDSISRALGEASKETIQDSIYHYLNRRVNFSGDHSPYSTQLGEAVIAGEPVDQAAINQTLIAMLRGAGIEAKPVLTSTRKSGKINMDFPSFYQFNAQMVQTKIGGETFLMDASFPYSQPGLISVDMYNGSGLVIGQHSFEWIDINPRNSTFDIDVNIDAELQSDGTLEGTVKAQQRGYPAQRIRQQRADGQRGVEILKRALFESYPRLTASNIRLTNTDSYDQPVELSADFEIENYAISFTDGLKFRPMIVGARSKNPFKDTDRRYPITLDAPEKLDVSYSIALPRGYSAKEGRQNRSLNFPGAEFQEKYDMRQGELNYEYHIDIGQKEFSTDLFPQLYKLYKRWADLSDTAWLIQK